MRAATTGLVGLLVASPVAGQVRGPAWGGGAVAVASEPWFLGGGPVVRWPIGRQVVLSAFGAPGRRGDEWVARGEATIQFRLRNWSAPRPSWYLAGGVAGASGADGGGYLVAGVGYEVPISAGSALWSELGAAGGVRLAVGIQSRRYRRK